MPPVLGEMVLAWLVLMTAIGAATAAVVVLAPRHRSRIPLVVPLLLGVVAAALAVVMGPQERAGWAAVAFGQPLARAVAPGSGGQPWLWAGIGLVVGSLAALGSFYLERALVRWRPPGRSTAVLLPGRRESIQGVARVARRPWLFLVVSVVSAAGEELLFRGAMLGRLWAAAEPGAALAALWWLVPVQAVLFGGVHLAFGWRTVLPKTLLGAGLAVGALCGGLVVGALLPHLLHQVRVLAQFSARGRPVPPVPSGARPSAARLQTVEEG